MDQVTIAEEQWKNNALKWRGLRVIDGGAKTEGSGRRSWPEKLEVIQGGWGEGSVQIGGAKPGTHFFHPVCVFWEFFELQELEREVFCVAFLDAEWRLLDKTVGLVKMQPHGTFLEAQRRGAKGVLVIHNRPSGDPSPERRDLLLHEQLLRGSRRQGVAFDHVIMGWRQFYSFNNRRVVTIG